MSVYKDQTAVAQIFHRAIPSKRELALVLCRNSIGLVLLLVAACQNPPSDSSTMTPKTTPEAALQIPTRKTPTVTHPTRPPTETEPPTATATLPAKTPLSYTSWQGTRFALYGFKEYGDLGGRYLSSNIFAVSNHATMRFVYISDDPLTPVNSPANASSLEFAHYSNRVAYWIDGKPGQLWLADLEARSAEHIYSDLAGTFQDNAPRLNWTPDDLHVILDSGNSSASSIIVSLDDQNVTKWGRTCDRVANSPKTNQLALWCQTIISPEQQNANWAIVEWGGEIWYADVAPRDVGFSGVAEPESALLAWSPNGDEIALLDKSDRNNYRLLLADSNGKRLEIDYPARDTLEIMSGSSNQLQWSQDGTRLLAWLPGDSATPCPSYVYARALGQVKTAEPFCWRVLDVQTGETIWHYSTSESMLRQTLDTPDLSEWLPYLAAISPDGGQIALEFTTGISDLGLVIELATGKVVNVVIDEPVNAMRFGVIP